MYLTVDDTGDVITSRSPSPKTRSRSPSPGRVKSPVRVHAQASGKEGAAGEPDVEAKSTAPASPTKSPSGSPSKPSTQVGARQFSIPTKVSAFKLNSFYSEVIGKSQQT